MKIVDLRKKNVQELKQYIVETRKNLFNIRFQKVTSQVENSAQITFLRRNIARAKTLLTEQKNI